MTWDVLDWHHPPSGTTFDVILASDVIYWESLIQPLVRTLAALCHAETVVLLGYVKRFNRTHRRCFPRLRQLFSCERVVGGSTRLGPEVWKLCSKGVGTRPSAELGELAST